jgi:hypothetical protein
VLFGLLQKTEEFRSASLYVGESGYDWLIDVGGWISLHR